MHIHPNSNLVLATLGAGRNEVSEIQARRAAEIRRKLSLASRILEDSEELSGLAPIQARSYKVGPRPGDDDSFGQIFSAKA